MASLFDGRTLLRMVFSCQGRGHGHIVAHCLWHAVGHGPGITDAPPLGLHGHLQNNAVIGHRQEGRVGNMQYGAGT